MSVVDKKTIENYARLFTAYVHVRDNSDSQLDFLDANRILGKSEGYKTRICERANRNILVTDEWTNAWIGSGRIDERIVKAVKSSGNLVNVNGIIDFCNHFDKANKNYDPESEKVIYELYKGDCDMDAFNHALKVFGAKYSLLAYLMFIKDPTRYLPISPSRFDRIFRLLSIDFTASYNCSWNNYSEYLQIIQEIRDLLVECLDVSHELRLIDAHSFLWIIGGKGFQEWCMYNSINIPLYPQSVHYLEDGSVNYECNNCGYTYKKAMRCPECGQLVADVETYPSKVGERKTICVGDSLAGLKIYEIINKCFGTDYKGWMRASYVVNDEYWAWFPVITAKNVRPNGNYGGTEMWSNTLSQDRKTIITMNHDKTIDDAPESERINPYKQERALIFARIGGGFEFLGVFKDKLVTENRVLTYRHDRIARGIDLTTFELIEEDKD